jgi:AraC-like DNA-binding protein
MNRRQFRLRLDNFFADGQERHLHWVVFSFGAALTVGVLALLSALFMTHLGALLFSFVLALFYGYFAVRFIRYGFSFRAIEPAMEEVGEPDAICPATFALIDARVDAWIAGKGFTQQGMTRDKLAAMLFTNRSYLSAYLNRYRKQTFAAWINTLRIEEARRLMLQHPGMNMQEIAFRVGYSHRSHFSRRFTGQTGCSPAVWQQRNRRPSAEH